MTNYVLDKENLKLVLLAHKAFVSDRIMKWKEEGRDLATITYRESDKITDEFIEKMINQLPIDTLLDQVDEVMRKTMGTDSKTILNEANRDNI